METQTRPCGEKKEDAKGCVWKKERSGIELSYPGLRSGVGKLMRKGLEEWRVNTEGKLMSSSGERAGGKIASKESALAHCY